MIDLNNKLKYINNSDHKYYSVDVSNYEEILKVKNIILREKQMKFKFKNWNNYIN